MWTLCVITTLCIFTQAKANLQIRESEYEVVDETKLTTLPIDVQFDQVSLLSCANLCSSSNKTCYSYIYDETTRHCILGSWLVPLKASQQKVQGKIFSSGKFCNTTRNITVLSDGSISDTDLKFCTGQDQLWHVVNSSDPRPLVTLRSGLQVMCDTVTDGGGWTIFQRRVSGTVDFNRNWMEYRNGFGDFSSGNFYLGNENIYLFTSMGERELRVDMTFSETSYFAKYSSFNISSEDDGYRLHVSGYTGNLASGLGGHNGMMFSTPDRDNDLYDPANCASSYHGGWWFRSCISSFLNAEWGTNKFNWNGYRYTSFIEMKFRPA